MFNGRTAALVMWFALAVPAAAQATYSPPRTAAGYPDLQGVWTSRWITTLERPPEAKALVVPAADTAKLRETLYNRFEAIDPLGATDGYDIAGLLVIGGEYRSSLVVDPADGKLPYTAEGRSRRAAFKPYYGDEGPERRGLNERCISGGNGAAPFMAAPAGNIRRIVQTVDSVVIWTELFSQLRIIPLDGRNGAIDGRQGQSSGRWEGETLVVETSRITDPQRSVRGSAFMVTPETRIVERFTRTAADEMRYTFTVEDPLIYSRPWTAETVMKISREPMFEFACHEANYGLAGILGGARAMERRVASAAKKGEP